MARLQEKVSIVLVSIFILCVLPSSVAVEDPFTYQSFVELSVYAEVALPQMTSFNGYFTSFLETYEGYIQNNPSSFVPSPVFGSNPSDATPVLSEADALELKTLFVYFDKFRVNIQEPLLLSMLDDLIATGEQAIPNPFTSLYTIASDADQCPVQVLATTTTTLAPTTTTARVCNIAPTTGITRPSACNKYRYAADEGDYEKTLCYFNVQRTASSARRYCDALGLDLYDRGSSDASRDTMDEACSDFLNNNSKIKAYIFGRTDGGTKCKVVKGDGRTTTVSCSTTLTHFCEFVEKPTEVKTCNTIQDDYNTNKYVDTTGIANPKSCRFGGRMDNPQTTLTVTATANENIIAVDMEDSSNVEYAPMNLGESFPNMFVFDARNANIQGITDYTFKCSFKVRYIDLSKNNIQTLRKSYFADTINLEKLEMVSNPLIRVSRDIFGDLPKFDHFTVKFTTCMNDVYKDLVNNPLVIPQDVPNTCNLIN